MAIAEETTTRDRTLKRLYRNRGATEATKKLGPEVQFVILESIQGGGRVEADLAELFPAGMPEPCMGLAAAAFGLNTVLGNEIAGKDKTDPAALIAAMADRWDDIREGVWSEGRGGPRVTDVLNAWAADAKERGKPVTDASIEKMRQRLLAGEVASKDLLNDANINAQYQAIQAHKAMERLEKAKAEAAKAGAGGKFDDVFNA